MADNKWLRALDALTGIAAVSSRVLAPPRSATDEPGGREAAALGALGQVEARLAGVVVAALKEAFDRDRARMDLERSHLDAERERAERALRLELLRQSGERALWQLRLLPLAALALWITSALLIGWLPGMGLPAARILLGLGWASLIGTIGTAFVAHGRLVRWLAGTAGGVAEAAQQLPDSRLATASGWLLVGGLALLAASAIVGA